AGNRKPPNRSKPLNRPRPVRPSTERSLTKQPLREVVMADTKPTERHEEIQFRQLLEEAVTKPATLMRAYSLFWNYSLGNQILALIQANRRGIALGPIASFNRWKELGRHVKRGEKAIELCMPVTCKRTVTEQGPDGTDVENEITFKRFVFRRN